MQEINVKLLNVNGELFVPVNSLGQQWWKYLGGLGLEDNNGFAHNIRTFSNVANIFKKQEIIDFDHESFLQEFETDFSPSEVLQYRDMVKMFQESIKKDDPFSRTLRLHRVLFHCAVGWESFEPVGTEGYWRMDLMRFYPKDESKYIVEIPSWLVRDPYSRFNFSLEDSYLYLPERGGYFYREKNGWLVFEIISLGILRGLFSAYFSHLQKAIDLFFALSSS